MDTVGPDSRRSHRGPDGGAADHRFRILAGIFQASPQGVD